MSIWKKRCATCGRCNIMQGSSSGGEATVQVTQSFFNSQNLNVEGSLFFLATVVKHVFR